MFTRTILTVACLVLLQSSALAENNGVVVLRTSTNYANFDIIVTKYKDLQGRYHAVNYKWTFEFEEGKTRYQLTHDGKPFQAIELDLTYQTRAGARTISVTDSNKDGKLVVQVAPWNLPVSNRPLFIPQETWQARKKLLRQVLYCGAIDDSTRMDIIQVAAQLDEASAESLRQKLLDMRIAYANVKRQSDAHWKDEPRPYQLVSDVDYRRANGEHIPSALEKLLTPENIATAVAIAQAGKAALSRDEPRGQHSGAATGAYGLGDYVRNRGVFEHWYGRIVQVSGNRCVVRIIHSDNNEITEGDQITFFMDEVKTKNMRTLGVLIDKGKKAAGKK